MKKFLPLLNKPARNGPFLPKFWTALATVIVGIFFRKNFWWGFRPISVAYQKEFWISWKKRRFQIFQKPSSPGFQSFLNYTTVGWLFNNKVGLFGIKRFWFEVSKWNFHQLNIYIKYIFFESFKGVAWKLHLPRPFTFQN